MPLAMCPWMAARCPHYQPACEDDKSKQCLYIKTATMTARATLQQLKTAFRQLTAPDPALQQRIKEIEDFVDSVRG